MLSHSDNDPLQRMRPGRAPKRTGATPEEERLKRLARLATILQVSSDYLLGIRTKGMDASADLSTTVDGEETEHVPVMVATA